jgi:DNA-binding protein HU-beta
MTKAEVIAKLTKKTGINKTDVQIVVEELLQLIQTSIITGESVQFKGFGKFFNKKRGKKVARNLADNTALIIEEHYIPSLRPAKAFINQVKANIRVE